MLWPDETASLPGLPVPQRWSFLPFLVRYRPRSVIAQLDRNKTRLESRSHTFQLHHVSGWGFFPPLAWKRKISSQPHSSLLPLFQQYVMLQLSQQVLRSNFLNIIQTPFKDMDYIQRRHCGQWEDGPSLVRLRDGPYLKIPRF